MSKFTDTADSRETDIEIMEAIERVAIDENDAVRMWESPTDAELVSIQEIVTNNGMRDATDYCWGEAGSNWTQTGE